MTFKIPAGVLAPARIVLWERPEAARAPRCEYSSKAFSMPISRSASSIRRAIGGASNHQRTARKARLSAEVIFGGEHADVHDQ